LGFLHLAFGVPIKIPAFSGAFQSHVETPKVDEPEMWLEMFCRCGPAGVVGCLLDNMLTLMPSGSSQ
jgi:hypothetical protein